MSNLKWTFSVGKNRASPSLACASIGDTIQFRVAGKIHTGAIIGIVHTKIPFRKDVIGYDVVYYPCVSSPSWEATMVYLTEVVL
jgi:hypothetical protein